jgi:hypothetical protein
MDRKQFVLRIDPELWKELEKWAADELRSINAQIEWLLRDAVRRRKGSHETADSVAADDAEGRWDDDAADTSGAPSPDPIVRHHS